MIQVRDCEDLEQLILYSGILKKISFPEGLELTVKSLNDSEEKFIYFKTGLSVETLDLLDGDLLEDIDKFLKLKDFMANYVAYSIIFINNFCCLKNRHENFETLKDYFFIISFDILYSLFYTLLNLKQREYKALDHIPDFCRTSFSHYLFSNLDHVKFNSYEITGIPNYEEVPLSHTQLLFYSNMKSLVDLEARRRNLFPFKFIAGVFSSDAVKSLDNYLLKEEIERVKYSRGISSGPYSSPSSVREIVDQLHDMVSGKEDQMDSVIKREERRSYEAWKVSYLERFKNLDPNLPALGDIELPDLSEEALLRRYAKEFRFSSWLLDDYLAENKEE